MSVGLASQFRALWESSELPPDVFAFLEKHGNSDNNEKLFVLLNDQQCRWRTDQPLKVEEYLLRLPDLEPASEIKLQLAVGEFQAQQSRGLVPSIEQFTARFVDLGDVLRNKLLELNCGEAVEFKQPGSRHATHISKSTKGDRHLYCNEAVECEQPELPSTTYISKLTIGDRQVGRYRLLRVLGEGTFGRVFLAFDEELHREVAVKVPAPRRFRKAEDAEDYLAEARTVAGLDHPNIVPVHDVGRTADGSIYVVSKFIEGCSLRDKIRDKRPGYRESAKLLGIIAQALHHAHQRRLIHRDIKPANLLIEERTGTPYLADFGLAIREEMYLQENRIAGTPAYMSPEQARGEGHRLDGRSDIFSMGIVLYELLTGKRPFRGSTSNELLYQLISMDPVAPRELDDSIPAELERICLKALAKRASDRYSTALEMADDLLSWQQHEEAPRELRIIPKGLRSFDADDADFFLDLLPGARDREGIPESIRFWKQRIEKKDPDQTFSVGLIYGPSGCGKSSLVKAGLLPRLSQEIIAVYLEATPLETETRILRGLRKHVPKLPADLGMIETFQLLRRREGRKVLLVLDQFEQWLHARSAAQQVELVNALRQCDGARLQAVIMVRDDFTMAAARFMDELDVPIRQGHNFATVDFFDVDHARKVLTKFGQAFGKLPDRTSQLSPGQEEFVSAAASGLAQNGQVVPVRLALFAEMVKSKPWVPATLEEVGGTEGIGVNFLEETFCSRTANPQHRLHERAAREVLKALLPEVGSHIRGHMRSHGDLLAAAGYQDRLAEFNELLRILDGELRLVTPTDPEGFHTESESDPASKYFQLTHDYLVAALRQWLTKKQQETRRGRAEIRLDERTGLWSLRREAKQLPSLWEWAGIRWYTAKDQWSTTQRAMMRAAAKRHLSRVLLSAAMLLLVILGAAGLWRGLEASSERGRIDGLVSDLWQTEFKHLPQLFDELTPYRSHWETAVASIAEHPASSADQRTRAYLALSRRDGRGLEYLQQRMLEVDADQQQILRQELRPWKEQLSRGIWERAGNSALNHDEAIRAAAILADYAPDDSPWMAFSPEVAESLVATDPLLVNPWVEELYPVRHHLLQPLIDVYYRADFQLHERLLAASILARFNERDERLVSDQALSELVLDADSATYRVLEPLVRRRRGSIEPLMQDTLRTPVPMAGEEGEKLLSRQANAVETLFRLGDAEPFWAHLGDEADPRLRARLVDRVSGVIGDWRRLLDLLLKQPNPRARQAVVIGLAGFQRELSQRSRVELTHRLLQLFRDDRDAGVHSACQWLLQLLGANAPVAAEGRRLMQEGSPDGNWSIEVNGLTMVHISRPGSFTVGSPEKEAGRDRNEQQQQVSIDYSFAISTREITLEQFLQYQPEFQYDPEVTRTPDCPVNKVTLYQAMKFCRWLSEQEPGFESEACCYPALDEISPGMRLAEDYLTRPGYRLPTVLEWEYSARAGSLTSRFFGNSEADLDLHCWSSRNARERMWPVGRLRPNPLGLFDVYGNVAEWCHRVPPALEQTSQPVRGGDYRSTPRFLRSAMPVDFTGDKALSVIGFRVAKTLQR